MENVRDTLSGVRASIAKHTAQLEELERRTDELAESANEMASLLLDFQRRVSKFEGGVIVASVLYALVIGISGSAIGVLIHHIINDK